MGKGKAWGQIRDEDSTPKKDRGGTLKPSADPDDILDALSACTQGCHTIVGAVLIKLWRGSPGNFSMWRPRIAMCKALAVKVWQSCCSSMRKLRGEAAIGEELHCSDMAEESLELITAFGKEPVRA
eukprot:2321232-Amphidinium_carterae.2